jgi:V8-like Glu-specific endopeptidase
MIFDGPVGFGVCGGDSGSPWYRYTSGNDIVIAGITILGEAWGADQSGCAQYAQLSIIEKWTKIRDTYSVTIMT